MLVVPGSNPEIRHPGIDILWYDGTGDLEPPMSEELFGFMGGQGLVRQFWRVRRETLRRRSAGGSARGVLRHLGS